MNTSAGPLPVVHLVSAMPGSGEALWGKERVIAGLMRAQRRSGVIAPRLLTFGPCGLASVLSREGFHTQTLADRHRIVSLSAFLALRQSLSGGPPAVLHTHGYKANVAGRAARASGAPMRALVSTCHGWIDETARTWLYNHIDRATALASDVVTVTDRAMLSRFGRNVRSRYVANGIEDRRPPSPADRLAARTEFNLPRDRVLAGFLGRTEALKGMAEILEAARQTRDRPLQWVIAGTGAMEDEIARANLSNVTFLGYVEHSDRYLDALDIYVQASHTEGLSLALLEAMRAQLPIVATSVGSTADAVRDMQEALLVPAVDPEALVLAVRRLLDDSDLAAHLAVGARSRFECAFQLEHQHQAFLDIYLSCERGRA